MPARHIPILTLLMRQHAWMALVPLLVALITGGIALNSARETLLFAARGVEAQAVISNPEIRGTQSSGRTPWVGYGFETREGEVIHGRTPVSPVFHGRVRAGDTVTIRYLLDDPERVLVDRGDGLGAALIFGAIAMISLGLAFWGARYFWRRTAAMLRAARAGERRSAQVVAHVTGAGGRKTDPNFRLRWRDASGAEGKSLDRRRSDLERVGPVGATITLLMDPVSEQSFWEQDLDAS
jgi:hypothetical protein